ncbi:MAG TPA: hypothetical protein VMD74_00455 [Candidatus Methylomirabilis sp.]|nr:hypothetical protein [Candidatus Methylomirabilis sp.]
MKKIDIIVMLLNEITGNSKICTGHVYMDDAGNFKGSMTDYHNPAGPMIISQGEFGPMVSLFYFRFDGEEYKVVLSESVIPVETGVVVAGLVGEYGLVNGERTGRAIATFVTVE